MDAELTRPGVFGLYHRNLNHFQKISHIQTKTLQNQSHIFVLRTFLYFGFGKHLRNIFSHEITAQKI